MKGSIAMDPLYCSDNTSSAYQLNWGLTLFWRNTAVPDCVWWDQLVQAAEGDGVRLLKHRRVAKATSQFFVSTKPHVAPSQLIRSVKGRLQYAVRDRDPKAFQRNYCVRSIGAATRERVEAYVASQLGHHRMADPRVQARLADFQRHYPEVDLSRPRFAAHGQYWYNLHVCFGNDFRVADVCEMTLNKLRGALECTASKYDDRLSRLSILSDHIHLTMNCPIDRSPEAVALSYLNNGAYAYGMKAMFQYGYYVGTFGEYDRGAV
jgi:REP element-mobilizing transposase RayT